jgi:hypothetical protein
MKHGLRETLTVAFPQFFQNAPAAPSTGSWQSRISKWAADPASTSSEAGDVLPIPGNADSGLNGNGSSNIDTYWKYWPFNLDCSIALLTTVCSSALNSLVFIMFTNGGSSQEASYPAPSAQPAGLTSLGSGMAWVSVMILCNSITVWFGQELFCQDVWFVRLQDEETLHQKNGLVEETQLCTLQKYLVLIFASTMFKPW